MSFSDLISSWKTRISRDIGAFIDPGTELTLATSGRNVVATWTSRTEAYEATFAISTEAGATVEFRGAIYGYRSFFGLPEMADLGGLARMVLKAAKRSLYVTTYARREGDSADSRKPAVDLIAEQLQASRGLAATAIVMVTGDAGAGKTSVLQELVRQTADKFIAGDSDRILLYVNAQGRALARFDEALATELHDLRARLTYHAVPTLTRLGLLVPVIDGFDELLGVSGYDEAFSSLSRFVEDLDGEGQIVASARSTYYEQEFVSRANSISALGAQIWEQVSIRVLPWGPDEARAYVQERLRTAALEDLYPETEREVRNAFAGRNRALQEKPFFVAQVVGLVIDGVRFSETEDLVDALIRANIAREHGKLRGRSGEPLLTPLQIESLLEDVAEEMWNQESRELDARTLRELAEYFVEIMGVPKGVHQYVIERMPAMAFLTTGARRGSVAFEHESFFSYFLGHRIATRVRSEAIALHLLLGRSVMPDEAADAAAEKLTRGADEGDIRDQLAHLSRAAVLEGSRSMQVRENGGLLAASLLRNWCAEGRVLADVDLADLTIPGRSLTDVSLERSTLLRVVLRRVDLSGTRFLSSRFVDGLMQDVLVDPRRTRLEFADFDPSTQLLGIRVTSAGTIESVFDPTIVGRILRDCGMVLPEVEPLSYQVEHEVLQLLKRIARHYTQVNPICVNEDDPRMATVSRNPKWPQLERILIESGVARPEERAAGGRRKTFLRRRVRAEEIMLGADPRAPVSQEIRHLWVLLSQRFAPE